MSNKQNTKGMKPAAQRKLVPQLRFPEFRDGNLILIAKQEFDMNPAQFFEKIQALPPDKQAEVFDFIEFLASRSPAPRDRETTEADWTTAEFSQMAMSQAIRGMEDEPLLYSLDDLRERWQ